MATSEPSNPAAAAASPAPNMISRLDVVTHHGTLNVTTSTPNEPPPESDPAKEQPTIVLIHGNSCSSQIFHSFFFPPPTSSSSSLQPLCKTHRIIAIDLPGHGLSSNAPDGPFPPANSSSHYTVPSYASAMRDVLNRFNVGSAIVFGHSLGGHIGIQMIPLLGDRLKGLLITGTPPVPKGGFAQGFKSSEASHMQAIGKDELSEEDIRIFAYWNAGVKFGGVLEPWVEEAVRRTDGRARKDVIAAFAGGEGDDQMELVVKEQRVLLGVVNGAEEPFVNLEFLDGVEYGNLWKGKCVRSEGLGHTPFWEKWEVFEPVVREFVDDVTNAA